MVPPQILDVELWHTSGHWANYRENMFFTELDERQYAVKPMNCPMHCLMYKVGKHSYRDLPIRYADFGRLHRYERSGVTSGLTRVRSFAQDDAHAFCTDEQVEAEVEKRLRDFARSARMPGFRPGKIPVKTLRQRYGVQIRGEVFSELMQSTFGQALVQEKLNPVAQPAFTLDMDPEARRYAYTATFDVLPEFELSSLAGKTLKRPVAAVADADLEALVERLREQLSLIHI